MKTQFSTLPNDRRSRLIVSVAVGVLVLALVVLFAVLVADVDDDGTSTRHCPMTTVTSVNPATCQPYGSSSGATAAPGTNKAGSSARRPGQKPQQKAPAAKVPAAPKAPAAPPRVSLGRR